MKKYASAYLRIREEAEKSGAKVVAVSKGCSLEKILEVYEAGCRDFGENRVDEALLKRGQLPPDICWHFVGTLQSGKIARTCGQFSLIHSVDSVQKAQRLKAEPFLLQVNVSGESSKHGFSPLELPSAEGAKGLMTMAPLTGDEAVVRASFMGLKELALRMGVQELSMGMSNDYHIALECGSTLLRIGRAIFA